MRQRSDRKLSHPYVLMPQGMCQRLDSMQSFVECKEGEYEMLKIQIVSLREELAARYEILASPVARDWELSVIEADPIFRLYLQKSFSFAGASTAPCD